MHRPVSRVACLLAAASFCACVPSLVLAEGEAQPTTMSMPKGALPTDPRLVTGTLDNGLSYIVVKHSNPPGRANIWLHVDSGSLNETDPQRGIAHYLEHMAFNGSKNFAPGTLVPLFESLGLTFGRHQNAFTSFEQTTFQLSLPDTSAEKVDKSMQFMSDVAFNLLLDVKEIDEERQIILEEKRTRLSAQQRVQEAFLKELAPGSIVGDRLPIGTEGTILGVQQQDFKDYYSTWYQPSNMTVIVVADADPEQFVAKIKEHFAQGVKTPRPVDRDAKVSPYASTRGLVLTDAELTNASIDMIRVGKADAPVTTYEQAREQLVDMIATSAFNRRMDAKISRGEVKSLGGSAQYGNQFNALKIANASFDCKPEAWRTALTELGTEVQRARLHGFTQREIDDVTKNFLAGAEQAVKTESTMPARNLIASINSSLATGEPITSAAQDLAFYKAYLPTITMKEVHERFANAFNPEHVLFSLQVPASVQAPSKDELVSMGEAALSVTPAADAEVARATSLMTTLPTPGAMSNVETHAASDVTSGWLSNGVRFHHRFMDIRKDQATISINLAGGAILENAGNRGVTDVAALAWGQAATSKLSSTDVRDLMTGKNVRVGGGGGRMGGGGDDVLSLTVSGNPQDLEAGMQLAHLLLTEPVIEQSAFDQWKERMRQSIEARTKNPQAAFGVMMSENVFPKDDARTQPLTIEQLNALTLPAAQAWLKTLIATSPIEVGVVGDISLADAQKLVAQYVGSLDKRERMSKATLDDKRALKRPMGPVHIAKTFETDTPQAMVVVGFYTADAENVPDTRAMQMAAQTLSSRMVKVIREKEQLVYSIRANSSAGRDWPGFGMFSAGAPTDPAKVTALQAKIEEMYNEFAQTGPTEEEMTVAKKQMANTWEESMKDPSFWLGRIATMDYRNSTLDDLMAANDAYQGMPAQQVKDAFNKYYKPESFMSFSITPESHEGAKPDLKPEVK